MLSFALILDYEIQDQQERAAFIERNPHTTQQHRTTGKEPVGPKQKQDRAQGKARMG
jgi:hypothetical protein